MDAPEIKTDNKNEKKIAIKAREVLKKRILGKMV